jgi:hypothetical protein
MRRLTQEQYLNRAVQIHGDLYDYSKTKYTSARNKIIIGCKLHGAFEQRAYCHTDLKQGCPRCAHNFALSRDDFIERSKKLYGDKYELIGEFNGVLHPVTLSCKIHGPFVQRTAQNHFTGDGGCPKCALVKRLAGLKPGNTSKIEKRWLDSLGVDIEHRQRPITIDGNTFVVDGFDPETNTIYECYGSYWHGNPEFYDRDGVNPTLGVTFGELYDKTVERENTLKRHFTVVSTWVR